MAMYYYASKISAIACGTRCRQTVLQKSRGQRDRDKCGGGGGGGRRCQRRRHHRHHPHSSSDSDSDCCAEAVAVELDIDADVDVDAGDMDVGIFSLEANHLTAETALLSAAVMGADGIRFRRRHSTEQLNAYDLELGFQQIELATAKPGRAQTALHGGGEGLGGGGSDVVQYDIPKNTHKRSQCDINFESSVLGSGGIMYINGRIVSGPLESLIEILLPKSVIDLDKEFVFSFLLSSRLFLRPHELLGKLLDSVPDSACLESLVCLLGEWTHKFPYDYRDERMMNHVKHIVARCSNSHLEAVVSQTLSALLKRLTDLERHEADLRACQTNNDKLDAALNCPTATQYAQIVCRLEKKLAKHVGPEEFLQCSSMVLLDKQKKWDQPSTSGGPPGAQDPKKTCNLETYLDWSARLRLFVCNEILQCSGIRDRSRTVELWSGVAQYCLLVGNYNSATAILESLESPAIARLKITWSKLQVTCQQLDCMQRHAEGHGHLWQKQAIVLNEQHHQQQLQQQHNLKTDTAVVLLSTTAKSSATAGAASSTTTTTSTTALVSTATPSPSASTSASTSTAMPGQEELCMTVLDEPPTVAGGAGGGGGGVGITTASGLNATPTPASVTVVTTAPTTTTATISDAALVPVACNSNATTTATTRPTTSTLAKPNDWVVIPVFADIVKLALAERENCLQRLPNGHININAFDRMAAIVGAFTKHMQAVKSSGNAGKASEDDATLAPPSSEYEHFCWHMQQTTKLSEAELMMASFDCEEPNNAEKLMYDLN